MGNDVNRDKKFMKKTSKYILLLNKRFPVLYVLMSNSAISVVVTDSEEEPAAV